MTDLEPIDRGYLLQELPELLPDPVREETHLDGDHVFVERFADVATRVKDIAASYLLALAALVFAEFQLALPSFHRAVAFA